MRELDVRPLGAFSAVFYIGACALYSGERGVRALFIILSLLIFAGLIIFELITSRRIRFRVALISMSAGIFAASLFSVVAVDVKLAGLSECAGNEIDLTATVRSVSYSTAYSGSYIVETYRDTPRIGKVKMILYTDNGELDVGDIVSGRVLLSSVMDSDKYEEYVLAEGAVLWGESTDKLEVVGHDTGTKTRLTELRMALSSRLKAEMSDEGGGFAAAMILGDKSDLSPSAVRDFKVLGISHVIALSGTHLTSLMAITLFLIPCDKRTRFFIMVPLVLFYIALTGFSASVVRAGIMSMLVSAGAAINKKDDGFTSLSASVLLICIFNMYAPFDVGLQLSFVSVAGLIVSDFISARIPEPNGKILRSVKRAVVAAFTVPIVLLPIMWLRFGEMSLAAPFANIVLAPVLALLIPILGVLLVVSALPPVFAFVAYIADVVIRFLLRVTNIVSLIADPVIGLDGIVVTTIVVLFTVTFILAILGTDKVRRMMKFTAVFLLCLTVVFAQVRETRARTGMTVCFDSVGGDDCVYINSGRQNILVDIGRYTSALRCGAEHGEDVFGGRIDVLMLSHLHRSHKLSLYAVCENYYVGSLWLPVPYDENSLYVYEDLLSAAKVLGINAFTYVQGETLTFGDCELFVPEIVRCDYSDHPSISFRVKFGDYGFVYSTPGAELIGDISDDVYVLGSHGPAPKGILDFCGMDTVTAPITSEKLDAISDKAVILSSAVIRYLPGKPPFIVSQ